MGARPEELERDGFVPVGREFPVFLHPKSHEEYALARVERKVGPGYRGFTTQFAPDVTLEDDLRRRDLTINAMAETPSGDVIDPYGGASGSRGASPCATCQMHSWKTRCGFCASRASLRGMPTWVSG